MAKGYTVHTIVKNEDIWIWFALQSVLPFVDQVLVFDTGSFDKTVEIIKSIRSPKIILEEKGVQEPKGLVKLRQEQIERTKTEWLFLLDGDEVWPEGQLRKLLAVSESASEGTAALFNRTKNCLGDIYHYLPDSAGRYEIAGVKGHLNMRMIRKTPDLRVMGEYPLESYINKEGKLTEQEKNLRFVDCWYLHTSCLRRSGSDRSKKSGSFGKSKIWEKGLKLQKGELPEVFSLPRPGLVADPLVPRGMVYEIVSAFTTPLLNLKRAEG